MLLDTGRYIKLNGNRLIVDKKCWIEAVQYLLLICLDEELGEEEGDQEEGNEEEVGKEEVGEEEVGEEVVKEVSEEVDKKVVGKWLKEGTIHAGMLKEPAGE
ncbi:High mobility group nucleosome-binding domain-containing protein 5 [Balamuthia mandrillaris]